MNWIAPTFCEVKMDAEIGSYNEDPHDGRDREPATIKPCPDSAAGRGMEDAS
jgi:hypothetical protein